MSATTLAHLLAAENAARAAAVPLLAADPRLMSTAEGDAARLTLGGAKLAIRRAALAAGRAALVAGDTLDRLRPYTRAIDGINLTQDQRQIDAERASVRARDERRARLGGRK